VPRPLNTSNICLCAHATRPPTLAQRYGGRCIVSLLPLMRSLAPLVPLLAPLVCSLALLMHPSSFLLLPFICSNSLFLRQSGPQHFCALIIHPHSARTPHGYNTVLWLHGTKPRPCRTARLPIQPWCAVTCDHPDLMWPVAMRALSRVASHAACSLFTKRVGRANTAHVHCPILLLTLTHPATYQCCVHRNDVCYQVCKRTS
jgi:hypothetical protein